MSSIPSFKTNAYDDNGQKMFVVDVGKSLLSHNFTQARHLLNLYVKHPDTYRDFSLIDGIPREFRLGTILPKFQMLEMKNDADNFLRDIGGEAGFEQWYALQRYIVSLASKFNSRLHEYTKIMEADFVELASTKCTMFYDSTTGSYGDIDSHKAIIDDYNPAQERPTDELNVSVRKLSPPYVWETYCFRWEGLSATDVSMSYLYLRDENGDELPEGELFNSVKDDIFSNLDTYHHEDASSEVVDLEGLKEIIDTWLSTASPEKLNEEFLQTQLSSWNAKQNIESYTNTAVFYVGLFPDVTKKECIQYALDRMSHVTSSIELANSMWRTPYTFKRNPVLKHYDECKIYIYQKERGGMWSIQHNHTKIEYPTFELALENAAIIRSKSVAEVRYGNHK